MRRKIPAAIAAGVLVLLAGTTDLAADAEPRDVLRRAFENRYEIDTKVVIDLVVRSAGSRGLRRKLVVATRRIDGRMHSLGRFLHPEHLRGTTLLNIENPGRIDDHFLFMPSLGRMRRVAGAQRSDAFVGTDLAYEDLERRRVGDYEIASIRRSRTEGEPVIVVEARPRFDATYRRITFVIAVSDHAILETLYSKRASAPPFKRVLTPRIHTRSFAGHALPMRMWVENHSRGTTTDVRIEKLEVDPDLDESLFTSAAIESGRPLRGLE